MAISFPTSPQLYDVYTVGSKSWSWNGYAWDLVVANTSILTLNIESAFATANNANMDADSAFFVANNTPKAWNSANNAYTNANTGVLYAQSAFNKANSAGNDSVNAYIQANTALNNALGAFAAANNEPIAKSAFAQANTALNNALGAFNKANSAGNDSVNAYIKANSAGNDAVNAFTRANTAINNALGAFDKANSASNDAVNSFIRANTAYNTANIGVNNSLSSFIQANTAYNTANIGVNNSLSSFIQANTALNNALGAFNKANSAGNDAVNVYIQANTALNNALGAFNKANSAGNDAVNAYTKANTVTNYLPLSGGTLTGRVVQSTSGFSVASKDIIYTRTDSGFWQTSNSNIINGWPQTTSSWYHLLTSTHNNDGNYYSMQFAGDFFSSNTIYYRATNGDGNTAWNKIWHSGNHGTGSSLDADLLDGQQGSYYAASSSLNNYLLLTGGTLSGNLVSTGNISAVRLISTVATGIAPLTVSSTTLVTNLNADLLDGENGSYYTSLTTSAFNKANSAGNDSVNAYIQANTALNNALGAFNAANNEPIAKSAFASANTALNNSLGSFNKANSAGNDAVNAYIQANTAINNTLGAFNQANTAVNNALGSFNQANTALNNALGAFNKANSAGNDSVNAYTKANSASNDAVNAFIRANTAINNALGAFDKANSAGNDAVNSFIRANTALNNALGAFNQANTAVNNTLGAFNRANSASNDAVNSFSRANTALNNALGAFNQANTVTNYLPLTGGTLSGNLSLSQTDASPVIYIINTNSSTNRYPQISIDNYGGTTGTGGFPVVELRDSRGTSASPTSVSSGDILGGFNTWGHNGSGFQSATRIQGYAAATFSSAISAGITFFTTLNNSQAERMRIDENGNVGIGTSTPSYKLEVNGSFTATTKSFLINHPTKPNKKLRYGSLEGPENGVYIRGRSNSEIIELPDYWIELVHEDSITVNLTAIWDSDIPRVKDIIDNKVIVFSKEGENLNYFYIIFAERKDVEKLIVEF